MNYTDLIYKLADELQMPKTETKTLLEEIISEFSSELSKGNSFSIPDLGTFKTRIKESQKMYNPQIDKFMMVPPKRIVLFTSGKQIKDNLKSLRPKNE